MVNSLSPREAQDLIAHQQVDIVDVREPGEWLAGHCPAAPRPTGELRAHPRESLPRDGVIFVCAAGVRSQTAAGLGGGDRA